MTSFIVERPLSFSLLTLQTVALLGHVYYVFVTHNMSIPLALLSGIPWALLSLNLTKY